MDQWLEYYHINTKAAVLHYIDFCSMNLQACFYMGSFPCDSEMAAATNKNSY